ncbi:NUDIX domain-containing protein [Peterkaempfera bronchialis]|uniref:NUDIX domain-containing protein n=1 Tax=Peterkaempfera bronchialis TaxID=2126346 RepID=A0A345T663_9ACTN|nr:NUDIX domain-containing protein [Peterkaempfera bronchialis]
MPITPAHIRATIDAYAGLHPKEKPGLEFALRLLDEGADLTDRTEYRGHATATAVLIGPTGKVLFIHHRALSRWLMPGGHVEPQDGTLLTAALRELAEETGIRPESVVPLGSSPLQIEVHAIPADEAKGERGHRHIDFRYLFRTAAEVAALQAEEVTGAAWRHVRALGHRRLRRRMAEGVRRAGSG